MVIDELLSGAPEETPPAAAEAPSASQGTRLAWMAFATVLLGAAALAIPATRYLRETPPTALPEMRVDIKTPQTPKPLQFALSPDGMRLVFVAAGKDAQRQDLLEILDDRDGSRSTVSTSQLPSDRWPTCYFTKKEKPEQRTLQ